MPFTLQQAVQSLQCEPPVKVSIKFSTRWWTTLQNHRGGVSRTDRPTRIVVYLSYSIDTDTATMIVSYTWTQDAPRNAAFVKGSVADKTLRAFTLSNLAEMHSARYEWLVGQYQDHDTWSWHNSEFWVGACMTFYDPSASKELISDYSSRVYFVENEELISTRRSKRKNRSTKSH